MDTVLHGAAENEESVTAVPTLSHAGGVSWDTGTAGHLGHSEFLRNFADV